MMKSSVVAEKSYSFSVRIVKLYLRLHEEHRWEHALFEQLLCSGTSIGANIQEAAYAQSRKDFINKQCIALKEASETLYWLRLLTDTEFIEQEESTKLQADCSEIIRILTAIVNSSKDKRNPEGIST